MNDDKTKRMIEFLQSCPVIQQNPLFFNFGNVEDNAHQVTINSDDVDLQRPYIDGSVLKRYTCVIDSFKSVSSVPLVSGDTDENVEDFSEVQSILDWINDQGDVNLYPDFGEGCNIDSMKTLSTKPTLVGIESTLNPPVAIYRIVVQIDYVDSTKRLWN